MEKSAFRTILAQGPSQAAGGVKVKGLGEKSAKTSLVKSGTTHGVVSGRGTGGSAVAGVGGAITTPRGGKASAREPPTARQRGAAGKKPCSGPSHGLESSVSVRGSFQLFSS